MDALLIIILVVGVFAILSGAFRASPPPQIIYVQPVTAEPAGGGLGCLLWVIGLLALLVVLGVVKL